jgi:hypothetical protein
MNERLVTAEISGVVARISIVGKVRRCTAPADGPTFQSP